MLLVENPRIYVWAKPWLLRALWRGRYPGLGAVLGWIKLTGLADGGRAGMVGKARRAGRAGKWWQGMGGWRVLAGLVELADASRIGRQGP